MITKPFAHHTVNPDANERIKSLRAAYSELNALLGTICPKSRELSISLTELETSAMWAIKAIAHNDPHSIAEEYA